MPSTPHKKIEEALEEALDHLESLNCLWNWHTNHKTDETEFRAVQKFLSDHGRTSQECKF